jgi:hypothetical protein
MPPPNHRCPALPKAPDRPALWLLFILFSASPILFLGCAGANSTEPTAAVASAPSPTETPAQSRTNKKSASDVHLAVEKASQASQTAAEASQKALQASKQARQAATAASQAEGENSGAGAASGKSVVTLETSGPASRATPAGSLAGIEVPRPTPAARPKSTASLESVGIATPGHPVVASSGEPNPVNSAKLVDDVDKTEKRIDRNNLSADESQRDILAQKMLQDAKKALADRDNVAATSLATKASILLAPLPKIPSPASSSMR